MPAHADRGKCRRGDRALRPPPPVYTAERVAAVIIRQLRRPRREAIAGGVLGWAFVAQHAVFPGVTERLLGIDVHRSLRGTAEVSSGNLHDPDRRPGSVGGGWQGRRRERRRQVGALALLASAGAAVHHRRR